MTVPVFLSLKVWSIPASTCDIYQLCIQDQGNELAKCGFKQQVKVYQAAQWALLVLLDLTRYGGGSLYGFVLQHGCVVHLLPRLAVCSRAGS